MKFFTSFHIKQPFSVGIEQHFTELIGNIPPLVAKYLKKIYFSSKKNDLKSPTESIDALREMLSILESHEIERVRGCILRQATPPKKESLKISRLLEVVLQDPDVSMAKLSKLVYGRQNDNALKFLRLRLLAKIQDALSGSVAPESMGQLELAHALSAKVCLARRLWNHGAFVAMQAVLNAVIRSAETFECFGPLLEALGLAMQFAQLSHSPTADMQAQVAKAEQAALDLKEAHRLAGPAMPGETHPVARVDEACGDHLARSASFKARFYAQIFRLQQLEAQTQNDTAMESVQELLALLRQPALANPEFRQIACCHHAHVALVCRLPQRALDALMQYKHKADDILPLQWQATLLQAEAHRLLGRPTEALALCIEAQNQATMDPSPIRKGLRSFLAAIAAFQAQRFEETLQSLNETDKALLADPHWNAAHRLLLLQTLIELKQFEVAELRIEALRKFLKQLQPRPAVAQRFALIVKQAQLLIRFNFEFVLAQSALLPGIQQLAAPGQPCGYPYAERYCFHDWLKQKIKGDSQRPPLTKLPYSPPKRR
jgi:hypothetical protein